MEKCPWCWSPIQPEKKYLVKQMKKRPSLWLDTYHNGDVLKIAYPDGTIEFMPGPDLEWSRSCMTVWEMLETYSHYRGKKWGVGFNFFIGWL